MLAARRGDRLESLASELRQMHSVTVEPIVVDLSVSQGVASLIDAAGDVDEMVANAGATIAGRVGTVPWDELEGLAHLVGTGVAQLCDGVVPGMVERGSGRVTIVASIGALVPMAKSAVYAASKAFAVSYARSLSAEVQPLGVRVCAVCPGYVRTELHERAGLGHLPTRVPSWMWLDSSDVVSAAEAGLDRNRTVVVPGLVYRAARPFLQSSLAMSTWTRLTRRR